MAKATTEDKAKKLADGIRENAKKYGIPVKQKPAKK